MITTAQPGQLYRFRRARFALYLLAFGLGGFMIFLGSRYLLHLNDLTRHGVKAEAEIYNVRYGGSDAGLYRFQANGLPYRGQTDDTTPNKHITVVYLPDNPKISEDVATLQPIKGWWQVGVGVAIIAIYLVTGSMLGRRSAGSL